MFLIPVFLSALFAIPTLATPVPYPRIRSASTTSENWTISAFTGHFMGDNSGLPGNAWPPNSAFNTTLSFTLNFPDNSSSVCSANFQEPPTPSTYTLCQSSGAGSVSFKVTKTPGSAGKWALYDFLLDVVRVLVDRPAEHASRHISANNASNADGYLTCLAFAPLTGVQCQLGGVLGRSGPITVSATG